MHGHFCPHRGAIAVKSDCTNMARLRQLTVWRHVKTHSYEPCDWLRNKMEAPAISTMELVVDQAAIDLNGHVSNIQYVQWMQDAAMAHSASLGWPHERYVELGATWIIRSHAIEYFHSAYAGDKLTVYTWVESLKKFRSLRKFKFYRPADDTVLARAETLFIFCNIHTGRPQSLPEQVQKAYPVVPGEDAL